MWQLEAEATILNSSSSSDAAEGTQDLVGGGEEGEGEAGPPRKVRRGALTVLRRAPRALWVAKAPSLKAEAPSLEAEAAILNSSSSIDAADLVGGGEEGGGEAGPPQKVHQGSLTAREQATIQRLSVETGEDGRRHRKARDAAEAVMDVPMSKDVPPTEEASTTAEAVMKAPAPGRVRMVPAAVAVPATAALPATAKPPAVPPVKAKAKVTAPAKVQAKATGPSKVPALPDLPAAAAKGQALARAKSHARDVQTSQGRPDVAAINVKKGTLKAKLAAVGGALKAKLAAVGRTRAAKGTVGTFAGHRPPKTAAKLADWMAMKAGYEQEMAALALAQPDVPVPTKTAAQHSYMDFIKKHIAAAKQGGSLAPQQEMLATAARAWRQTQEAGSATREKAAARKARVCQLRSDKATAQAALAAAEEAAAKEAAAADVPTSRGHGRGGGRGRGRGRSEGNSSGSGTGTAGQTAGGSGLGRPCHAAGAPAAPTQVASAAPQFRLRGKSAPCPAEEHGEAVQAQGKSAPCPAVEQGEAVDLAVPEGTETATEPEENIAGRPNDIDVEDESPEVVDGGGDVAGCPEDIEVEDESPEVMDDGGEDESLTWRMRVPRSTTTTTMTTTTTTSAAQGRDSDASMWQDTLILQDTPGSQVPEEKMSQDVPRSQAGYEMHEDTLELHGAFLILH
jgi:hypothetical protein